MTELMEGSLEGHLKDKLTIFKKIRDRSATREEETGFMYVPIRHMTNWLRKALIILLKCDRFYKNFEKAVA